MKKIIIAGIIGLFLVSGVMSATLAGYKDIKTKTSNSIEKTFYFSEPEISRDGKYLVVSGNGMNSFMMEGYPILPYKTEIFKFPAGTKINVEFSTGNINKIKIDNKVKPYPFFTKALTTGRILIEEGDIYSEERFPDNFVDYRILAGIYNGERCLILSVFLHPYIYEINENSIIYTDKINLRISYDGNPLPAETSTYDFLIISPDAWLDELSTFKQHKESKGIKTIVVGLSEVYAHPSAVHGRDDAEKVKYFIKNAIEEWGIKYVMLVGGRQGGIFNERWLMPVRYTNLDDRSGWETGYLSDLYFADIYKYENGSIAFEDWDSNGNGIYAEWKGMKKDKLDLVPDVYVGRLACRSKMELKIVIEKIIKYESENQAGKEWFKKMVVVAGDTFPYETDPYFDGEVSTEKALEYMSGFEGLKLYTSTGTLSKADDIINAVSNGCGFLNFEGHGNPMSWATHPPYDESTWIGIDVTQFPQFSNKDMYPVCVIGGCHNSQFNVSIFNLLKIKQLYETYYKSEWSPGCFGEWIVRKIDGGAIASIGCTGLGYGLVGDYNKDGIPDCIQGLGGWIDIEFFRLYGQEKRSILGEIHSQAIANYVANFPVMKNEIDCKTVQEWTLLGDPTLKIGGYS
ncbi:MAG: hypothetical protein H5T44_01055 [Thermoplasmatales archaeon]|nr:hypothetical protein [Thermoplasmatales archaeon]